MTTSELFVKDFRKMVCTRRDSIVTSRLHDLRSLPVCNFTTLSKVFCNYKIGYVSGIEEDYFNALNKKTLYILPRTSFEKKLSDKNGKYIKDASGKYMTRHIAVKRDFIAVLSFINIHLKNYTVKNDVNIPVKVSDGFNYVDFVKYNDTKMYVYTIPKSAVRLVNPVALVLSKSARRIYYTGYRCVLQDGSHVYIYAVPFSTIHSNSGQYRVLGVKLNCNFEAEYSQLLKFWAGSGVMFPTDVTEIIDSSGIVHNLGYTKLSDNISEREYHILGTKLSDCKCDIEFAE